MTMSGFAEKFCSMYRKDGPKPTPRVSELFKMMGKGMEPEEDASDNASEDTASGAMAREMDPFPVEECFPPKVALYIRELAKALQCDPVLVVIPMMAATAAAIGGRRSVRINSTWEEPCALWTILSVASGANKSAVVERVHAPMAAADREMQENYALEMSEYFEALDEWKKKGDEEDRGPCPRHPTRHRLVVKDTTIEKLAILLASNPRGLLVSKDELTGWFTSMTRYSGVDTSDKWLSFHDGKSEIIDRQKYDVAIMLERPLVSVCGGIQPGILAKYLNANAWASGLAQRFLVASPPVRLRRYFESPEVIPGEAEYRNAIRWLVESLNGDNSLGALVECAGGYGAKVRMSPEAHALWVKDHDERCARAHVALGGTASTLFKLVSTSARWALCHHMLMAGLEKGQGMDPISVESVKAGISLAHWFEAEALRLLGVNTMAAAALETSPIVRLAISMKDEGICPMDVYTAHRALCPNYRAAVETLNRLVHSRQLVKRKVKGKRKTIERYFPVNHLDTNK
jgi:hypothetical protein